jgi:hypothetical protein
MPLKAFFEGKEWKGDLEILEKMSDASRRIKYFETIVHASCSQHYETP